MIRKPGSPTCWPGCLIIPANKVVDLLPWNWKATQQPKAAAAA
jgi:hypothetical protein